VKKEFVKSQIIRIIKQNNMWSQRPAELGLTGNALSRSQTGLKFPMTKSHTFVDFGKQGFPVARNAYFAPCSKDGPNHPTNNVPKKSS
jgi:hypothetical protein